MAKNGGFWAYFTSQKKHLTCDLPKLLRKLVIVYRMGSGDEVSSKMEPFLEEI